MNMTERSDAELRDIVEKRLAAFIREMEDADWQMEEIVQAMNDVLRTRWLDKLDALEAARSATPPNFVSDGNEG